MLWKLALASVKLIFYKAKALAKASFGEAKGSRCSNCSLPRQELQYRNTSWHVHFYKTVQAWPAAEQLLGC